MSEVGLENEEQADQLRIEYWPIEQLIPSARNARTHSASQIAEIASSIRAFGFINPLLVGEGADIVKSLALVQNDAIDPGCVKNSDIGRSVRTFVSVKLKEQKNHSGWRRQRKKTEKAILRVLRAWTFSHSLDPSRKSAGHRSPYPTLPIC
jgi:hypothetical protein